MDLRNLIPSFGRKSLPVRQEQEHPFVSLQREMNRLFDGFLQDWDRDHFTGGMTVFTPRIEVTEDEKAVTIAAELPGISEKEIDVSINGDSLTICGEKKDEREERKGNYFYSERSFGSFSRTIRIPGEVDADKIQADFGKGILRVVLPKTAQAKNLRRITVKAE